MDVGGEDVDADEPKDSKPAKRKAEVDPEAAVGAAAAAAAKSNDAAGAYWTEKNKCNFALLLLALLQTGEMDFRTLLAKVKANSNQQLCFLYKRKMKEILQGGVHALFDFRETGIEALLQVWSGG